MLVLTWILAVSSILSASYAAPVTPEATGPPIVNGADFDGTIAKGTWWVKFFHPFCHHCIEFAPVWDEFHNQIKDDASKDNFHLASVDCMADGDLCDRVDILAYPTLFVFEDGKMVYEYASTDRSVEKLLEFKKNWVKGIRPTPAATSSASAAVMSTTSAPSSPTEAPVKDEKPDPLGVPNPKGKSLPLTRDTFEKLDGSWLVKFHSPKCPHCLEMQQPWNEMAKKMKGKLNIGEVNCDILANLCREQKIDKIPNIRFYDGEAQTEYKGLRGHEDLLEFAKGAVEVQNIQEIDNKGLDQAIKASDAGGHSSGRVTTNFVYFYDEATMKEDFEVLRRVAVSVIGNARVYKSQDKELIKRMNVKNFPSLYAATDVDRFMQYPAKTPKDIRDTDAMISWAKVTWLSLVPQLNPANAREILDHAKYVVLAVIDPREIEQHELAIKEMKTTALNYFEKIEKENLDDIESQRAKKQLKIDEAEDRDDEEAAKKAKAEVVKIKTKPAVGFAWIDQVFWERWIQGRYGHDSSRSKPRIIINDENGGKYWDVNVRGKYIDVSRSEMLDILDTILDPRDNSLLPKALHNSITGYFVHVKVFFSLYWHWLTIAGLIVLLVRMSKRRRNINGAYHAPPLQLGKLD